MIHIHSITETKLDPKTLDAIIQILNDEAPQRTQTACRIINRELMRAEK
jgi:hypothetical protein